METQAWKAALTRPADYIAKLKERDREIGACIEIREPVTGGSPASGAGSSNGDGPLAGLPFAVKNNIAVRGWRLTCGSKLLSEATAPYSATAVRRLEDAGAVVVATTNLDEFGMGSSTDDSAIQRTNNPWELSRVAGGSSGGSAAAVAAGEVPFALGSDTGGSVRQPASFCGVYGFKPTYGAVSRFGLTAYASSLEAIGILGSSAALTEAVFQAMRGIDEHDQSSVEYRPAQKRQLKKIAVLKAGEGLAPEVAQACREALRVLTESGMEIEEVAIPSLEYAVPAYYTIAAAEASANLARFNGIRYGLRPYHSESPDDLIKDARSDGFGPEVKLRIMLGTFVLRSGFQEQYYEKAQKIRTRIRRDMDALFSSYDLLVGPVFPTQAFRHGDESMDAFAQKLADKFTVLANLAGIPALAMPTGVKGGLPVGLQAHAPAFAEDRLFDIAQRLAKALPPPECPGRMGGL
jgi:aspartyl-tRNA(Asn)/glutamyl-tRNA(Gln) amidotransferase subunit A